MKRFISCMIGLSLVLIPACKQKPEDVASKIRWTGQASVIIETAGKTIYIDPLQIKDGKKADLILLTHSHYDHLSLDDIAKIISPDSIVLAPGELE